MKTLWFTYWFLVALIVGISALMYFTADNVEAAGMFLVVCIGLGGPAILILTVVCLLVAWLIRRYGK